MSGSENPTALLSSIESAGAFNELLVQQNLPAWLNTADPAALKALSETLLLSHQYHGKVRELLKGLRGIHQFAAPLLSDALRRQFGNGLDIYSDFYLQGSTTLVSDLRPVGNREWRNSSFKQSLLQAALHNFEASPASSWASNNWSGLVRGDDSPLPVQIKPEQFVDLCRTLDLGAKYQAHLNAIFNPAASEHETAPQAQARVRSALKDNKRHDLAVATYIAVIKKQISGLAYRMLLEVSELKADVTLEGLKVYHKRLNMLGQPLSNIMLFETWRPTGTFDLYAQRQYRLSKLVIYISGDSVSPLKEFTTWDDCENYLKGRLEQEDYRKLFYQLVPRKNMPTFQQALEQALADNASLDLRTLLVQVDPFDEWVRLSIEKTMADARFLAVPTADEDLKTLQEKRRQAQTFGMNLLSAASFFVPGVAEVVLAVTAVELMSEVFHGIEDWRGGDRREALSRLTDVAQNVALVAGVGAVIGATTSAASRFFDGLVPITLDSGQSRLWSPDLTPYEVDPALSAQASEDEQGLLAVGNRHYVRMDGKTYSTYFDPATGKWRLRHPSRAQGYAPILEHNGVGAWRAALDSPLEWQGEHYLFRRLGSNFTALSNEAIEQVLAVTGLDEAALRRIHLNNLAPPGALLDAVARWQLDQKLTRFIEQMEAADPISGIQNTLATIRGDVVLSSIWDVLNEQAQLLSSSEDTDEFLTAQQIAEHAIEQRPKLFDTLYSARNRPVTGPETTVCREFPGLPLPVVEQLIDAATSAERTRLTTQMRVPLPMAEAARKHLREVRLNRAIEGFYLDSVINPDTDKLSLHLHEQSAVDLTSPETADDPRLALARLATTKRQDAARMLGQAPDRAWFNPPRRLDDGRIGYPLSGRGDPTARRSSVAGQVRRLYPDFSNEQIENLLSALRISGADARVALLRRQREFESLDQALSRWVHESGPSTSRRPPERVQVANQLRRCWRRQTARLDRPDGSLLGYRLNLEGSRIGQLPELPPGTDFSHVVDLNLHDAQLLEIPEGFMRHFSGVQWLDISDNQLTTLPPALGRMTSLRALNLQANRIRLSAADIATLGGLRRLEELNLSLNRISELPDVSHLNLLRILRLRDTGIDRLPTGLLDRLDLVRVDLRDNRIRELPDTLFEADPRLVQHIVLHDNPLSANSLVRLADYHDRNHFYPSGPSHSTIPAPHVRTFWLPDADDSLWAQKNERWERLSAEPASEHFMRVLADLTGTSDFKHTRNDLTRRVWQAVDAAYENTALRKELFDLATIPRTCADSVLVIFSALEVKTLVFNVHSRALNAQDSSGLLTLARGLFRLEKLNDIATRDIADRTAITGVDTVDDLEVHLAYRIGLAHRLELPGQPRTMHFQEIAGVSLAKLDAAEAQILALEETSQLQDFIAERDFWIDFLEHKYASDFAPIDQRFEASQSTLWEQQAELTEEQYKERYLALTLTYQTGKRELVNEKTELEQQPRPTGISG
ncbi:hypothetical protein NVV94_08610 [Pseudomonas sp. LS1212]|uniref:NEL-type E3 ubiquitin ligase domain-containing protein n=1 Tax=Pseudomonas sp. LS1212 TaxID=2972478 RepID=UPI00215D3067|nr:NEL-type E3 ubiquitin ligase domain-containing protein [Pseudomonas sp. LS1212]UVJ45599.1 hypothetical protein NVV94_08610 [Pseudomonas sp. LS1212]